MDKYEYKVRAEEIKQLIAQGEYPQAVEIADTIDWRRVKSVMMLCTISDLYKINRRYEEARDLLLMAHDRRPNSRNICYSLCELSIKTGEYVQAVEYYKEFVQIAPQDSDRYVLQYKLYAAQDVSLEERIEVLEELKRRDYREKWVYELAYLYHKIGLGTKCVEECDELIMMMGSGRYVTKAMELKMLHEPLTPQQQEKYDHRNDMMRARELSQEHAPEQPWEEQDGDAELAGETGGQPQDGEAAPVSGDTQVYEPVTGDTQVYEPVHTADDGRYTEQYVETAHDQTDVEEAAEAEPVPEPAEDVQPAAEEPQAEPEQEAEPEEYDIHVKTMNVGEYDTINLQAQLAQGMQELWDKDQAQAQSEPEIADPVTRSIVAPMLESDTESLDYPEIDEVDPEEDLEPEPEQIESSEVFFGETDEDATGKQVMEQMRRSSAGDIQPVILPEPPKEIAHVLSQESDGQISMVLPETGQVEKQITGQLSIEDILAEWERVKKENEEKRKEEVRQHVLQTTGPMFTEFEEAVRDEILAKTAEPAAASPETPEPAAEPETEPAAEPETEESAESEADLEIIEPEVTESEVTEPEITEPETIEPEVTEPEPESAEETAEDNEVGDAFEEIEEPETEELAAEEPVVEEPEPAEDVQTEEEPEPAETPEPQQVRALTREEKELYAPFIQSRKAREQIAAAIDSISMAAYTGNVIVTGEEGMDTMTLARNMIREVQSSDSNFSGKVAKISGQALNKKDVAATLEQLHGGALIIQRASRIDSDTAKALHDALQRETLGIVIVLEDNRKAMNRFLRDNGSLAELFTARVDVEAMSNDTLVAFGRQYAHELEYSISELGILELHRRIEDRQTADHAVTAPEVKTIIDDAIRHAKRKTPGHFFDVLLHKRYDDEDMIVLTDKDF